MNANTNGMEAAVDILLVEDNEDHAELAMRALKKTNHGSRTVLHLCDGQEAIDYLFNAQNPLPRLILLDIKMPRVDGVQVLERIKGDEKKKVVPVIMMTSSKVESDIEQAMRLGANAYIVKPVEYKEFVEIMTQISQFWLESNQMTR